MPFSNAKVHCTGIYHSIMSSQPSDQSSVSDIGSTQDTDWIPPKQGTASSTDNSEDEGWIYDSFEEAFGKAQDDVNFDLGCLG